MYCYTSTQQVAIGPAAVPANGLLTIGTNTTSSTQGIYFGTDVNLYRSGPISLTTNSNLYTYGLSVQTLQNTAWSNFGTQNTTDDIVDYYNSSSALVGKVGATGDLLVKPSTNTPPPSKFRMFPAMRFSPSIQ